MTYPSFDDYNTAMTGIATTVPDPLLAGGQVQSNSWGSPFARTGSFAYTYKINTRTGDYAFRLFQTERKGMQARYKAVSKELASHPNPYFVEFDYLPKGIRVEGGIFPALRMRWADGEPLGVYIEKHVNDGVGLRVLQANIDSLARSLETAGIAHGDIQMSNVLVQSNGAVMLVDYDAMFVPALASMDSVEVGHPNFQHPERSLLQPFDATLDRFSFALIHTGLEALIEKPSLWKALQADSDALLFRGKDLADPHGSKIFRQLVALPITGVFAKRLASFATSPYAQTPTFSDFRTGTNIPSGATGARSSGASGSSPSDIPWYQEPVVTPSRGGGSGRGLSDGEMWIIDARVIKDVFDYAGDPVLLVGRIESVDTTVGGRGQPAVRLTLSTDGNKSVLVNMWSEGLKNFAAAGVTINDSWESRWISAEGTLSPVLGSPTGQYVSLTVTQTDDLQLITYHHARRILAGKENTTAAPKADTPTSKARSNDDLIDDLSGKPTSTGKKSTAASSGTGSPSGSTPGGGTPSDSTWGSVKWVLFLLVILTAAIAAALNINANSSSNSRSVSEPPTTAVPTVVNTWAWSLSSFEGKCLTSQNEIVTCLNNDAERRVTGTSLTVAGCGDWDVLERRKGYVCTVGMNESTAQPVSYETCTDIVYVDGPFRECFPGEQWSYISCWNRAQGAVLQQRQSGQWVTVRKLVAKNDKCMDRYPWTVAFDWKASGVGVKRYRVYIPEGSGFTQDFQNITVTVREK